MADTPHGLIGAVARLTGDPGRLTRHIHICRIKVISTDGKVCGIRIRVSAKKVYPNTRKQIANCLRLEPHELDDALENWTSADTRAHLEQFSSEVLDSHPDERLFTQAKPQQP